MVGCLYCAQYGTDRPSAESHVCLYSLRNGGRLFNHLEPQHCHLEEQDLFNVLMMVWWLKKWTTWRRAHWKYSTPADGGKASSINVTYTGHRLCHKNRASESKDGHLLKATKYRIMNDTDPDDKLSGGKNCRYEQENEVYHLTLQLGWGSQGD